MSPRVEECWRPDYSAARAAFRAAAGAAGARMESFACSADQALTTDVAVFGADRARRVLLVVSGIHGLEGPTGSAAQLAWIVGGAHCPEDVKVVMVHAANPWGYANRSRLTEHSVDLNRNFVSFDVPLPENAEYPRVRAAFPFGRADDEAMNSFLAFYMALEAEIGTLRASIGINGGQYHDPDGFTFGGVKPSWSNRTLRAIVETHCTRAERVALIDWHTGLGAYGDTAYLMMKHADGELEQPVVRWWGRDAVLAWRRAEIEAGKDDDGLWNLIPGQFRNALAGMLPQAAVTGATIEFGSFVDGDSWQDTVYDAYIHHSGDRASAAAEAMMERMVRMYNPADPEWRHMVVREAQSITKIAVEGLAAW